MSAMKETWDKNEDLDLLEEGSQCSRRSDLSETTRNSSRSRLSIADEVDAQSSVHSIGGGSTSMKKTDSPLSSIPMTYMAHRHTEDSLARPFPERSPTPEKKYPKRRAMVGIHTMIGEKQVKLRIMEFNIMADGLSALDKRYGDFSRVSVSGLAWDVRKKQLIHEISQYRPDVVTLQECDHYYDFFLPEMNKIGYDGYFASKPMSQCLEVSNRADGSVMFIHRKRVRCLSMQSFGYATGDMDDGSDDYYSENKVFHKGKLIPRCKQRKQQSQVAMVSVIELLDAESCPPIIIATTHLKAGKSSQSENLRKSQILQLLSCMNQVYIELKEAGRCPAIMLTGDFNTASRSRGLVTACYAAVTRTRSRVFFYPRTVTT